VAEPGQIVDAIAFNVDLDRWPDDKVETVHLAYRLDCNYYRGEERLQLMVEAIEPV
jgi:single-stranded-DNA-specific exonuclease